MNVDTAHTFIGLVALSLLTAGLWLAAGLGYALTALGALLLSALVYARVRQ